jgi:hypothetical protein
MKVYAALEFLFCVGAVASSCGWVLFGTVVFISSGQPRVASPSL